MILTRRPTLVAHLSAIFLLAACQPDGSPGAANEAGGAEFASGTPAVRPTCDPDNGGLTLPAGFCALVVHDGVGPARHLVVDDDGDIYVALQEEAGQSTNGIVALRDTSGDGRADIVERFGEYRGSGIEIIEDHLYFATDTSVVRYRLPTDGPLVPAGGAEMVIGGFLRQQTHAAKSLAYGNGNLWVGIGAPSNACGGSTDRQAGARGQDPCPELERQAGVWRFDAGRVGQQQADGERWAWGIRNSVALAFNPADGEVWVVQHGRDQLDLVSNREYDAEDNATRPAEELLRLEQGTAYSWPYCFYDLETSQRLVAPEYASSDWADRCGEFPEPVAVFGAHWAPNDLLFYTGDQFPERYRGGAFIAFHGSWNRAPLPQAGYMVVFQPLSGSTAAGDHEIFADGFAGASPVSSPGAAEHRPMGLAQGPDGSLYISDSVEGTVWRVMVDG